MFASVQNESVIEPTKTTVVATDYSMGASTLGPNSIKGLTLTTGAGNRPMRGKTNGDNITTD